MGISGHGSPELSPFSLLECLSFFRFLRSFHVWKSWVDEFVSASMCLRDSDKMIHNSACCIKTCLNCLMLSGAALFHFAKHLNFSDRVYFADTTVSIVSSETVFFFGYERPIRCCTQDQLSTTLCMPYSMLENTFLSLATCVIWTVFLEVSHVRRRILEDYKAN